jgi:hypothetical protein
MHHEVPRDEKQLERSKPNCGTRVLLRESRAALVLFATTACAVVLRLAYTFPGPISIRALARRYATFHGVLADDAPFQNPGTAGVVFAIPILAWPQLPTA